MTKKLPGTEGKVKMMFHLEIRPRWLSLMIFLPQKEKFQSRKPNRENTLMSSDVSFHHLAETSYKPGTELCSFNTKLKVIWATVQTPTWGGSPFMVAKIVTSLNLGLCLMHSNLLTLECGKRKYSIYCRVQSNKNEQFMLKRPKLPDDF